MPKQPPIDISLDRFADALEQAARKDIPDILGQAAVDAFKQNFQDEGFFGSHWKRKAAEEQGVLSRSAFRLQNYNYFSN